MGGSREPSVSREWIMNNDLIEKIPGATAFRDWYGWFPGFHDAHAALTLDHAGNCTITLKGYQITERVKPDGFFELEKHYRMVLRLNGVSLASFEGFMPGEAILDGLEFTEEEAGIRLEICGGAYGLSGALVAQRVELEFEPTDDSFGPLK